MRLFIVSLLIFLTTYTTLQANSIESEKKRIVKTTSNFYEHYIKNIGMDDGIYISKYLYTQKEIDPTFAQKIEHMEEVAKEDALRGYNIGYDPILLAQDIPLGLKYTVPVVKDGRATLKVLTHYGSHNYKPTILVTLKKVDTSWKIIDITKPTPLKKEF